MKRAPFFLVTAGLTATVVAGLRTLAGPLSHTQLVPPVPHTAISWLGLTDAQKAQMKAINQNTFSQIKALRAIHTPPSDDTLAKIRNIQQTALRQWTAILTPAQQHQIAQRFIQMRQEMQLYHQNEQRLRNPRTILNPLQEPLISPPSIPFSSISAPPLPPKPTVSDVPTPKARVYLFVSMQSPISNSYAPELESIYKTYASQGVEFTLVYEDADATKRSIAAHDAEYHLTIPTEIDTHHDEYVGGVATMGYAETVVVPQAIVMAPSNRRVYKGRIDNKYEDNGKVRPEATIHDLRDSIDAVLAGKPVAQPITKAVGCFL